MKEKEMVLFSIGYSRGCTNSDAQKKDLDLLVEKITEEKELNSKDKRIIRECLTLLSLSISGLESLIKEFEDVSA